MTALLAIDPGTMHSGWFKGRACPGETRYPGILPLDCGVADNHELLAACRDHDGPVAIEMIASYGMAVGKEVFETCLWIGRFVQAAGPERVRLVYRKDVKLHLCGTPRAKDPNVRQALIDRWGGKAEAIGNIKKPGPLYAVKSHAWAALGVAVTALETKPD